MMFLSAALPFSLYVGVRSSSSKIEWATTVAHNLLAYFLGDQVKNVTEDVCDDMDDQASLTNIMWTYVTAYMNGFPQHFYIS